MTAQRVSIRKKNEEGEEEGGEGEDRYVEREKEEKKRVKRCGMKTHLDYTKRVSVGGRSAEAIAAVIQKGQGRTALARANLQKEVVSVFSLGQGVENGRDRPWKRDGRVGWKESDEKGRHSEAGLTVWAVA
jgi:hypothetical protein